MLSKDIITKIKKLFSKSNLNPNSIKQILLKNLQIKLELEKEFNSNPKKYCSIGKLVISIVKDIQFSHCSICGKELSYDKTVSNSLFCSNKCKLSLEGNPFHRLKNKVKETSLKHYGVDNPAKSKEIQNKIKATNQMLYGVDNTYQRPDIIKKIQETNLKKYGTTYALHTEKIQKEIKEKFKERYNTEDILSSPEIRNKIDNTCNEKYGFHAYRLYMGWNRILSWKDYVIPLFPKEEYKGNRGILYKWKCVKCGNEFEDEGGKTTPYGKEKLTCPRCTKCYPLNPRYSLPEKELVDFCKQYFPNLKENNRKLIYPLEVDILIEDIKLAIEYDGCWFHSIENNTPLGYHLNKTIKCEEKGYRLIHINQYEWKENKEEIKKNLLSIFNKTEIIDYSQVLDRNWYPAIEIPGYTLEILPPEIKQLKNLHMENCGYLKYTKNKV